MLRDDGTLFDIAEACRLIGEFTKSLSRDDFDTDLKSQSAVLHQWMVLGEAAKRLSDGFRGRHGDIPWSLIAGMRDKLIHGYDDVDLAEVWRTVTVDIPSLLVAIKPLLPK